MSIKNSVVVKNFLAMFLGNAALVASQGIQFVIVARTMGAQEFGVYSAVLALVMVLQPLTGLGQANVLIFRAARDSTVLASHLGNALLASWCSALVFSLIAALALNVFDVFSGRNVLVIAGALCVAELLFARTVETYAHAFIAIEKVHHTSVALTLPSILRLVATVPWLLVGSKSAESWAIFYCLSNILVCSSLWFFFSKRLPWPSINLGDLRRDFGLGILFCVGFFSKAVYTDADKPLLARYSGPDVVGTYASGARLVAMALMPIRALTFATQARLFRAGMRTEGGRGGAAASNSLLLIIVAYGLVVAAVFWLTAGLVPVLLGQSYERSVEVVQWLCMLPLLMGLQTVLADVLTGLDQQLQRTISQAACALLFVFLGVALIPRLGWHGAVIGSYVSQLALVLGLLYHIRKARV